MSNIGRPRGKKDSIKRLERDGIGKVLAQKVEKLRNDGKTSKQIVEICGISDSTLKKIIKMYKLKPMISYACFNSEIKDFSNTDKICGIYAIAMYPTTNHSNSIAKYYIGSSCDIMVRIKSHSNDLRKNKHYNKDLQDAYKNCSVKYYIIDLCDEEDLLRIENDFINSYCSGNLFNKWSNNNEDISKVLDRASERINGDNYDITKDGCWVWKKKSKQGYGKDIKIQTAQDKSLEKDIYYIRPHRASYYKYNNEYPELIRHKCNNKRCVNPDHLESGSHSQNSKDKHVEKWKLFRKKWVEYAGDLEKISDFFGYKKNYTASDGRRYYAGLPKIIKKLKIQ